MLVAKICVCLVSSTTVSTETSEQSLSSATKSLVIGASARRNACGAAHQPQGLPALEAEDARRLELPARHAFERAAVDLALVGGVVEAQPEQRGHERRQPDHAGEAVVEDEQLQQHRRAAHHLDVAGQRGAQGAP